jgi:predicted DNA-binding transcriptional regulator AlpA
LISVTSFFDTAAGMQQFTSMSTSQTLSLTTAIAITDISESTWWRRIKQGAIQRANTIVGKHTRLHLSDVLPNISIPVNKQDIEFILLADTGNADAQNDVGQMFSIAGKAESAIYWLQQAASQGNPDAMQWLGQCYARGEGVSLDENLSMMWLAKSAALGHVIAKSQMDAILKRSRISANAPSITTLPNL